jgi:hypothetical protein
MASGYLDLTAMNAALKELYDGQVVENLVYADNPFLAMVPKKTDFGGKYKPIPIITGVSQGRSSTFSNAQGNQSAVQIESFLLTRASDYSIATIDNQTMLASRTDKMAFLEGSKLVIDGAIRSITNSLASALFRTGTGSIGQIATIGVPTTGVIQLVNVADIVQFEINMVLQANATDGGTPLAALGYVIAVNRSLGQLTVSNVALGGAAGSPAGWAATNYLLVQGDNNLKIKGLSAWLPVTPPTATDNFFGVNRSVDVTRLAGVQYNGSAQSIEEALIDASSLLAREGGKPDVFVTNFASYSALEKSLGSKIQYIDLKALPENAEIAFRGIVVNGANSLIKVLPDRNCQGFLGYMLQMNTWCLESLGDAPQILRYGDGLEMLRVFNADAGEVRVGYYAQLRTNAPGWNAQVQLSA